MVVITLTKKQEGKRVLRRNMFKSLGEGEERTIIEKASYLIHNLCALYRMEVVSFRKSN